MFELFFEGLEFAVAEHGSALVVGLEGFQEKALEGDEPVVAGGERGGGIVVLGRLLVWWGRGLGFGGGRNADGETGGFEKVESGGKRGGGVEGALIRGSRAKAPWRERVSESRCA